MNFTLMEPLVKVSEAALQSSAPFSSQTVVRAFLNSEECISLSNSAQLQSMNHAREGQKGQE